MCSPPLNCHLLDLKPRIRKFVALVISLWNTKGQTLPKVVVLVKVCNSFLTQSYHYKANNPPLPTTAVEIFVNEELLKRSPEEEYIEKLSGAKIPQGNLQKPTVFQSGIVGAIFFYSSISVQNNGPRFI